MKKSVLLCLLLVLPLALFGCGAGSSAPGGPPEPSSAASAISSEPPSDAQNGSDEGVGLSRELEQLPGLIELLLLTSFSEEPIPDASKLSASEAGNFVVFAPFYSEAPHTPYSANELPIERRTLSRKNADGTPYAQEYAFVPAAQAARIAWEFFGIKNYSYTPSYFDDSLSGYLIPEVGLTARFRCSDLQLSAENPDRLVATLRLLPYREGDALGNYELHFSVVKEDNRSFLRFLSSAKL